MAGFPRLKTGAVMQYPAQRRSTYSTRVLQFTDGSEQRFRRHPSPLRRWVVRLEMLDEEEMRSLGAFFEEQQGRMGDFAFTDPWDGAEYAHCSLEQDEWEGEWVSEESGRGLLVIRENRS